MKRKNLIVIALVLAFVLSACQTTGKKEQSSTTDSGKVIYTSFYPLEYMTKRIAGDKFTVKNIMPVSSSVHGWEPSAKQIADLTKAEALIINGAGLESWLEKFKDSHENLNIIDTSKNIDLISGKEEAHDHEEEEEHGHEEEAHGDHAHEEGHNEEEHSHGDHDPHFWISPKEASIQADNVYNALISLDKENENYFKENYESLKNDLNALDQEYTEKLSHSKIKKMIVPHKAFSYIERDYGIQQIPLSGVHGEGGLDMAKMKNIIEEAKTQGITDVLYEEGSSSETAEAIVKETGGKSIPIYSLEGISQEQVDAKEDYISLLRKNLEHFIEATN